MNRARRAAIMGVVLLSPLALSACSAGQVTQTVGQARDKVGAMAEVGDIRLRAVEFAYPRGGSYERGDDAELRMAVVNQGQADDALVDISGEGFGAVQIDDAATPPGGSGSPGEIGLPAGETVYVDGDGRTVTLTGLDDSLTTGQTLELTFTFDNAGEVTVPVVVSAPDDEVAREEAFDFGGEPGGSGTGE